MAGEAPAGGRLISVEIDPASIGHGTPDQEDERLAAARDLVEDNVFVLAGRDDGPYRLNLALRDGRLAMEVRDTADRPIVTHHLSLTPFRRILKDYLQVCDSHRAARRTASPGQIETVDMGRRGLHDEAGRLVAERLAGKIAVDHRTARRLFTLIVALHWKG